MNITNILFTKQIDPAKSIFQVSAEEALDSIQDMFDEFSVTIDFSKFSKEELEKIFIDYADALVTYHPEDYHQERAAVQCNKIIFKKHGLTTEELAFLDFT